LFPVGYQDFIVDNKLHKRPKVVSQYILENCVNAGAEKVIFIVGEGKWDLIKYYNDGRRFKTDIAYLYQEVQSGMPDALNLAYNWIKDSIVLFGMPDTIIEPNDVLSRLVEFHNLKKYDLTLGLFKTDNPSKFGMVEFTLDGKVVRTTDKPLKTNLEYMWGCCCWGPGFTKLMKEHLGHKNSLENEIVFGDIINIAILKNLNVGSFCFDDGQYLDIGTCEELDKALKKFQL